jgi:NADH-quinone oxidoreductase subunit J
MMELPILDILFYFFACLVLFSAIMVIAARNPVHSVLFLIFTFFNAAGLFVLLGAEYLAMTLVIVYVGAVAVLFLFVVMMMDIDFAKWREGFIKQLPVGIVVALLLFISLGSIFYAASLNEGGKAAVTSAIPSPDKVTNTEAIGQILYTDYAYVFLVSGLVLLVAMIGAIVLTLRHREAVKHQNISKQLRRTRKESVELVDAPSGQGVSL